jgi:gliding motility-associated lipoprotein GldH
MRRIQLLALIFIFLISCDSNVVQTQSVDFDNQQWEIDDKQIFTIKSPDTIRTYDLFINTRNNHEYAYSNLWLISKIKFPLGKVVTDTLEYQMAQPDGKFLGTPRGSGIFENKLWLKNNIRFTENGNYMLELKHAMRKNGEAHGINELGGILDIGYSLELHNEESTNNTADLDL